jgi:hypothetical protein
MLPLLFFTSYNSNRAIVTALPTAIALLYKPNLPSLLLLLPFFSLTYLLSLQSRLLKTLHYHIQFLITFLKTLPQCFTFPHHQHRRLRDAALAVHAALGFCSGHGIVRGDFAPAHRCLHVRRDGIPAGSGSHSIRSNFPHRSRTLSLRSPAEIG